jgi:hypothetical protein
MTLRETMARHARTTLTRPDHFGEVVVYRFKSGAPDRTVRAVVNRLDIEPGAPNVPQVGRLRALVAIPFDATDGITTVAPGDKIELALRLGAAAVVARVKRIESQDEGMFVVEVEG